jgi:hypothetical protein
MVANRYFGTYRIVIATDEAKSRTAAYEVGNFQTDREPLAWSFLTDAGATLPPRLTAGMQGAISGAPRRYCAIPSCNRGFRDRQNARAPTAIIIVPGSPVPAAGPGTPRTLAPDAMLIFLPAMISPVSEPGVRAT